MPVNMEEKREKSEEMEGRKSIKCKKGGNDTEQNMRKSGMKKCRGGEKKTEIFTRLRSDKKKKEEIEQQQSSSILRHWMTLRGRTKWRQWSKHLLQSLNMNNLYRL